MKKIKAILLFLPCAILGMIGILGVFISAPLFQLFNPKYKLPSDKAWIDVAPITSWCWKKMEWWYQTFIFNIKP
jgi:hypothetical protein